MIIGRALRSRIIVCKFDDGFKRSSSELKLEVSSDKSNSWMKYGREIRGSVTFCISLRRSFTIAYATSDNIIIEEWKPNSGELKEICKMPVPLQQPSSFYTPDASFSYFFTSAVVLIDSLPSGNLFAMYRGGFDILIVWDTRSGKEKYKLKFPLITILGATALSDSRIMVLTASRRYNPVIEILELSSGKKPSLIKSIPIEVKGTDVGDLYVNNIKDLGNNCLMINGTMPAKKECAGIGTGGSYFYCQGPAERMSRGYVPVCCVYKYDKDKGQYTLRYNSVFNCLSVIPNSSCILFHSANKISLYDMCENRTREQLEYNRFKETVFCTQYGTLIIVSHRDRHKINMRVHKTFSFPLYYLSLPEGRLCRACALGRVTEVKEIYKSCANAEQRKRLFNAIRHRNNPLFLACCYDKLGVVKYLCSLPEVDVNKKANGMTPLELASKWRRDRVVECLCKHPEIKIAGHIWNDIFFLSVSAYREEVVYSWCSNGRDELLLTALNFFEGEKSIAYIINEPLGANGETLLILPVKMAI